MKNTIKKIWGGVNVALIIAVAFLAIALAGVKLVGLDVYVILSGSMEPEYQTGGIIYIKDVDTSTLESGDVVTYNISNGATVTHRIVDVVEENGQTMYQTKGDANETVDASLVPQSQVIGQPVFTIPYLGYLVSMIQSPSGKFAMIAIAAILLLLQFLPDLIFGEEDDEEEEADDGEPVKEKRRFIKKRDDKKKTEPEVPVAGSPPVIEQKVEVVEPAPQLVQKPEQPATAPQPVAEEPASQFDSLQSFLDMDPDEFFNNLINSAKEERNNEK